MDSMVSKTFIKVMGFAGSVLLTIFAGIFAMMAICCIVMSVIDKDIISFILAAFCGLVAWIIWSVRKDTLV